VPPKCGNLICHVAAWRRSEAGGCVSRQPGALVFHDRYTIGPDVTMQLVDGEAVIQPDIKSWLRRFPARNLLSLLC
jgi:hypothetical protein